MVDVIAGKEEGRNKMGKPESPQNKRLIKQVFKADTDEIGTLAVI